MSGSNQMRREFWRLAVSFKYGEGCHILGTEELMREAIDSWKRWLQLTETEQDTEKVMVVDGFYDSADRAETQLVFELSMVGSMSLTRMY